MLTASKDLYIPSSGKRLATAFNQSVAICGKLSFVEHATVLKLFEISSARHASLVGCGPNDRLFFRGWSANRPLLELAKVVDFLPKKSRQS